MNATFPALPPFPKLTNKQMESNKIENKLVTWLYLPELNHGCLKLFVYFSDCGTLASLFPNVLQGRNQWSSTTTTIANAPEYSNKVCSISINLISLQRHSRSIGFVSSTAFLVFEPNNKKQMDLSESLVETTNLLSTQNTNSWWNGRDQPKEPWGKGGLSAHELMNSQCTNQPDSMQAQIVLVTWITCILGSHSPVTTKKGVELEHIFHPLTVLNCHIQNVFPLHFQRQRVQRKWESCMIPSAVDTNDRIKNIQQSNNNIRVEPLATLQFGRCCEQNQNGVD